jgi:hypothetical protein
MREDEPLTRGKLVAVPAPASLLAHLASRSSAGFLLTALACLCAATSSRADLPDDCIAAAEKAQPLQHEGKLREARDRLRVCTQPQCPALIRADCTKWLAEVEASTPTIVVHATDVGGADLVDVRVLVDGELVASSLDGRDIPIDPGPHVVRFERTGSAPVEEHVVADVGARHRLLSVTFSTSATPVPASGASAIPYAASDADQRPHRSTTLPLVVGAVGIVAAAVGGAFWGSGLSQCRSNIEPGAGPCTQQRLNGAHGSLVAGDVLVSVGGAALAVGVILWLVQGRGAPPPVAAMSNALLEF